MTDATIPTDSPEPAVAPPDPTPPADEPGGSRELLKLAAPLVVSQSFMTVQVLVDSLLLGWHDPDEMSATLPAMMWYWQGFGLLSVAAGYTSTFVAQYTGANRPHRVGPAVWQGIHFGVLAGLLLLLAVPLAPFLIALGGHPEHMQAHELTYFRCLCFAAVPMLVMSAVNGFFSGRGQTWTVLGIEAAGTATNVLLASVLIFGSLGFPELGIAGAGWATVAGSWVSALVAVGLFWRKKYRDEFDTLKGWLPERELMGRLMKFGLPAGMQLFLDVLVFNAFIQIVGRLGDAALGATTLTVRFNMIAFLPMMGMGQAVCILVGQRLGADRPDLAEKSAYTGVRWTFGYMCLVAAAYLLIPQTLVAAFRNSLPVDSDALSALASAAAPAASEAKFTAIAAIVPNLLICVAIYSLADALNVTFAFALRGAGDTRFVTAVTFALAWPIMVIPTYLVVKNGGSVYWAWGFATAHIFAMAVCFFLRFRSGKWKSMRVIEAAPVGGH